MVTDMIDQHKIRQNNIERNLVRSNTILTICKTMREKRYIDLCNMLHKYYSKLSSSFTEVYCTAYYTEERCNVCKKVYELYSKEIEDLYNYGTKHGFDDKTAFYKINELNVDMKMCFEVERIEKKLTPTWTSFK